MDLNSTIKSVQDTEDALKAFMNWMYHSSSYALADEVDVLPLPEAEDLVRIYIRELTVIVLTQWELKQKVKMTREEEFEEASIRG